jgi:hypothetical protein
MLISRLANTALTMENDGFVTVVQVVPFVLLSVESGLVPREIYRFPVVFPMLVPLT